MSNASRRAFLRQAAAGGIAAGPTLTCPHSSAAALNAESPAATRWAPSEGPNQPVGQPRGICPGRAIESVAVDFFGAEPTAERMVGEVDNYLHEAALAHQPPSATRYDPHGQGTPLASLGVHGHWNRPERKQYSRNPGTGQGIELVTG